MSNCAVASEKTIHEQNQFKRILIIILISLTIFQQMPVIRELFYDQIRNVLYISFGLFGFISLFSIREYLKSPLIKIFSVVILYSALLTIVSFVIGSNYNPFGKLIIPFGIVACSLNIQFSNRQLSNFMMWYAVLVVIMGVASIFYYGQGFSITLTYLIPSKNQIGPMLGIAAIILSIGNFNKTELAFKNKYPILSICLFLLTIGSLLAVRNRSGIVALFIVIIIFVFRDFKPKRTIKNLLIGQAIILLLLILFSTGILAPISSLFLDSLTLNYDVSDMDSLSAGRVGVYGMALDYVYQHPIMGEIGAGINFFRTPHNYILYNWVKLGLVLSLPIIILYLYLWFFAVRDILKKGKNRFIPYILLYSLIVSVFEYTYPYGPGVSQLMLWFLIGQSIKWDFPNEKKFQIACK